ncbi:MAG: NAD-dependent epimerase/dehydratase family protein [Proteobacteria bacterium]|nr:NAD-dependent epimerase/dehydratase family protein [Pseudomonadota bacterium]
MSSYLVTGGCGFIGSHLADALVESGHSIRILDDLSTGKRDNAPAGADVIVGDVGDLETVRGAMQGMDGCFHLAAIASVVRSNEDWLGTHRANLTGTINVFEAARNSGAPLPVVYVSSAAIYGDNQDVPLAEGARPKPLTAYGADKLGCELHARVAHAVHNVSTTGFRFFNIFGPRQDPASPYSGVISIFANRIREGLPLTIHGDGEQSRDFVYVRDAVRFMVEGMERLPAAPEVFNVCRGTGTSINALAEILFRLAGKTVEIRHADPRDGDIRLSVGDPSHARTHLGVVVETEIEDGLRVTLESL